MQTLNIQSNFELIKQLEPFVSNSLSSFAQFNEAIQTSVEEHLPELQPHLIEIKQFLSLYYGLREDGTASGDDDAFGQGSLASRVLNQAPIVNAGNDQVLGLSGKPVEVELEGTVIDDRLDDVKALFTQWQAIEWKKPSIPGRGEVTVEVITDADQIRQQTLTVEQPFDVKTKATIKQRGRYLLQLSADDGELVSSDELSVIVNEPPVISAGENQTIRATTQAGASTLSTTLQGVVLDDGLGDPATGRLEVTWSQISGAGVVNFVENNSLTTQVIFPERGHYLLRLTVSNDTFSTNAEVLVAVAARVTDNLQVLYTCRDGSGTIVS